MIGIGVTGVLLALSLKDHRRDMALLVSLAAGLCVTWCVISELAAAADGFRVIAEKTGTDTRYFLIILKITGISCCTDFAANLCRDAGESAVAAKLEIAGKVVIMAMTVPIIKSFLELCIAVLE